MRKLFCVIVATSFALTDFASAQYLEKMGRVEREEYGAVPMPPGFRITATEIEGPVFADQRGRTLYFWPRTQLRNGITGDEKNSSRCTNVVSTHTAGLMSPYPPGLELPELSARPSCADVWLPALASEGARPVGSFSIFLREDGRRQWAYLEHALYTSRLDVLPGDVMAASSRERGGDSPALRVVAAAPVAVPPGFRVMTTATGRLLTTEKGFSVYSFEGDGRRVSKCKNECVREWSPVLAPVTARSFGEWSSFERSSGVLQWSYRGKPLYTHNNDPEQASLQGGDVPGWRNVYTQTAPSPPSEFTEQDASSGVVLADKSGKTIYTYSCADDSMDQLDCAHPGSPQAYRLAICGGGDHVRCMRDWPYVVASPKARDTSRTWRVIEINAVTGRLAAKGGKDALRVWTYMGVPVVTYSGDKKPGDIFGHGAGEFAGRRNGFRAFFLRDDYFNAAN